MKLSGLLREVDSDELENACKESDYYDYYNNLIINKHRSGNLEALLWAIENQFDLIDSKAKLIFTRQRIQIAQNMNVLTWITAIIVAVAFFINPSISGTIFICFAIPLQVMVRVTVSNSKRLFNEIEEDYCKRKVDFVLAQLHSMGYQARVVPL